MSATRRTSRAANGTRCFAGMTAGHPNPGFAGPASCQYRFQPISVAPATIPSTSTTPVTRKARPTVMGVVYPVATLEMPRPGPR